MKIDGQKSRSSKPFVLQGGDSDFSNRQKLLFERLSTAEKECNKDKNDCPEAEMEVVRDRRVVRRGDKSETRRFSGKESIFKRPEGPAPRGLMRNIPDFRKNPHKWVRYSLDDVSNEDMSDKSNSQAAHTFLRELKARKSLDSSDKMEVEDNSEKNRLREEPHCSKILFKKPKRQDKGESSSAAVEDKDDKAFYRSSKLVMPEYVVGQKRKVNKNKKEKSVRGKVDGEKLLRLDHLQEEEDED